jgi:uncharacterized protein with HEPN domain
MPGRKTDLAFLWDILDAAKAIQQFVTSKTFNDYLKDRMMRGTVERHLEIIGEAANRVTQAFQEAYPEIPWRRIIAQRHVIAHEYGEIKHELIWKVATVHIPELIRNPEPLVPLFPENKDAE